MNGLPLSLGAVATLAVAVGVVRRGSLSLLDYSAMPDAELVEHQERQRTSLKRRRDERARIARTGAGTPAHAHAQREVAWREEEVAALQAQRARRGSLARVGAKILYHASPPENRAAIRKGGLEPGSSASYGPPAVYLFLDSSFAENYRSEPMDVWEVDATGIRLKDDPEDPAGAAYVPGMASVPRRRITFMGTFLNGDPVTVSDVDALSLPDVSWCGERTDEAKWTAWIAARRINMLPEERRTWTGWRATLPEPDSFVPGPDLMRASPEEKAKIATQFKDRLAKELDQKSRNWTVPLLGYRGKSGSRGVLDWTPERTPEQVARDRESQRVWAERQATRQAERQQVRRSSTLTVAQIQAILRAARLPVTGDRVDLVRQLAKLDALRGTDPAVIEAMTVRQLKNLLAPLRAGRGLTTRPRLLARVLELQGPLVPVAARKKAPAVPRAILWTNPFTGRTETLGWAHSAFQEQVTVAAWQRRHEDAYRDAVHPIHDLHEPDVRLGGSGHPEASEADREAFFAIARLERSAMGPALAGDVGRLATIRRQVQKVIAARGGGARGSAAMVPRTRVKQVMDGVTFIFKGSRYGPNSVEAFVPDVDNPGRQYAIGVCRAVHFDEESNDDRKAGMYARCLVDVAKLRKKVGSEGEVWVVTRADLESEQYMRRGYGRKMYEMLMDETARVGQDDAWFVPHACLKDGSTSVDADRVWMSLKRDHVYVGRAVSNVRSAHSWGSNVALADLA